MHPQRQPMHFEQFAAGFAALMFMLCAKPGIAQQAANDNGMPATETADLGTPVTESTLVSSSYEPPKDKEPDIFTQAYDLSKRSGTWIANKVDNIHLSSSDTTVQTAAPVTPVSVQQPAPAAAQPEKPSTWDSISDHASDLYHRTLHMFDKDQ